MRDWLVRNTENSNEYRNNSYKEQWLPLGLTVGPRGHNYDWMIQIIVPALVELVINRPSGTCQKYIL